MPKVEMYATHWCGYCARARSLLRRKGVEWKEIDVDADPGLRVEMIQRAGRRTVPQIFINGRHVGGSDDLYALEAAGKLDPLLTEDGE